MGSYRSEDEALIGLARQLTDAYSEARTREDQDYACDAVAEFLSEYRDSAPSEALLAIFDLPLTAETYPLVDEAQTTLAGRGPAVVELLLEAVLGEVYDPDGPAAERAAETLDMMERRAAVQGLVEVLGGRASDGVKGAAVDGLAALGTFAEPALARALDDPVAGEWAEAALSQIRYAREHPAGDEEASGEERGLHGELRSLDESMSQWMGTGPYSDAGRNDGLQPEDGARGDDESSGDEQADGEGDDSAQDGQWAGAEDQAGVEDYAADEDRAADEGGVSGGQAAEVAPKAPAGAAPEAPAEVAPEAPAADAAAGPAPPSAPDQQAVDDAYDEFLRRYRQESGEGPAAS